MIEPLGQPPKKDPQVRTRVPTLPPTERSRAALGLTAAAAAGKFMLQICASCQTVQYPPRDACSNCLADQLDWRNVSPLGRLVAQTVVRTSTNVYFRERAPWRIGTVALDAGPSVICHLHGDCHKGERVQLLNRLDKAGQGVLIAMPINQTPNAQDDPQWREISCAPKFRRVLITDGRSASGVALAQAFSDAGAQIVFVGEAKTWLPYPHRDALRSIDRVELLPLDVTDSNSVVELAGEIGGKTDILVNNARFIRPGGAIRSASLDFASEAIQTNYLGLMRLAQSFGPAMASRGADGANSATAWVNVLSVYALSNRPELGAYSASNAAAYSLSQCLRAELRASGIRVVNAFTGPTEDEWHQPLPPPKVNQATLARQIVAGLEQGLEDVFIGDLAQDIALRWQANPKVLEIELTQPGFL